MRMHMLTIYNAICKLLALPLMIWLSCFNLLQMICNVWLSCATLLLLSTSVGNGVFSPNSNTSACRWMAQHVVSLIFINWASHPFQEVEWNCFAHHDIGQHPTMNTHPWNIGLCRFFSRWILRAHHSKLKAQMNSLASMRMVHVLGLMQVFHYSFTFEALITAMPLACLSKLIAYTLLYIMFTLSRSNKEPI